jgi:ubiquitin-protein ligase
VIYLLGKQRILKEAQKIAKEYSFWMVSGNISHLYGYVYETSERKYELEIKFDENFPKTPPQMIYHTEIKDLLGNFQLNTLINWTPESTVVNIVHELKKAIENALELPKKLAEKNLIPIEEKNDVSLGKEEYITPDLNAYPPDFQYEEFITPSDSNNEIFYPSEDLGPSVIENSMDESKITPKQDFLEEKAPISVTINTELGLIQQEYTYDHIGTKEAEINVYITITLTSTFIIPIDITNYPERPIINLPNDVKRILGDPYETLNTLREWNSKMPSHIVDILHEIEKKLLFLKEIEMQSKKISGEYQSEKIPDSLTALKVKMLTYGFKEYNLSIDLESYPEPPIINLSSELKEIVQLPITELNTYKNWKENESEPVEIVREISWLVDKNSRINFELDLLKDHYKNLKYEPSTATLNIEMKGKMKTEDLTFKFQIDLPVDYPMKMPEIKVINEFELEAHEKIKNDLHTSFDDFFDEWTPFSYLVDLFNLISKKIFEVSVVSCVICHKIECPSCTKKIAGEDNCHAECPHCNRAYHNHCWEQTIKSFGKCGFCLR